MRNGIISFQLHQFRLWETLRGVAGGFPEPLTRSLERARQWHRQYLKSIIERDVPDIAGRWISIFRSWSGCFWCACCRVGIATPRSG